MVSYRSKRKWRIIVYGLVARYGPQSIAKRKWLTYYVENFLFQNCNIFSVLNISKYKPNTQAKQIINLFTF